MLGKLLRSKTIQGLLLVLVPYLDQIYQYMNALPEGVLPAKVALAVSGLGWILAFVGRMNAQGPIR